jgi:hypothetical protein
VESALQTVTIAYSGDRRVMWCPTLSRTGRRGSASAGLSPGSSQATLRAATRSMPRNFERVTGGKLVACSIVIEASTTKEI